MGIVRILFVMMLAISAGTMGLYLFTGNPRYRRQSVRLFRWTIGVLCLFFVVLAAQHL